VKQPTNYLNKFTPPISRCCYFSILQEKKLNSDQNCFWDNNGKELGENFFDLGNFTLDFCLSNFGGGTSAEVALGIREKTEVF
jgi:hypothetical protein